MSIKKKFKNMFKYFMLVKFHYLKNDFHLKPKHFIKRNFTFFSFIFSGEEVDPCVYSFLTSLTTQIYIYIWTPLNLIFILLYNTLYYKNIANISVNINQKIRITVFSKLHQMKTTSQAIR